MKSMVAEQTRRALVEAMRRLTPAQRLKAFLEHSELMAELREAGRKFRARAKAARSR